MRLCEMRATTSENTADFAQRASMQYAAKSSEELAQPMSDEPLSEVMHIFVRSRRELNTVKIG